MNTMEGTMKCILFELKCSVKSILRFFVIFLLFYIVALALVFALSTQNVGNGTSSAFFIAFFMYLFFSVSINYTTHYNFLMMLGNPRSVILKSQFVAYAAVSVGAALISVVFDFISPPLISLAGSSYYDLIGMLYHTGNLAVHFIWFLALYIMASSVSLFLGSLRYRFGRIFTRIFWIGLALLMMLVPSLLRLLERYDAVIVLVNAVKAFFGYGVNGGIFFASLNFAIVAALFGAATYLMGRRQELIAQERQHQ
ncbi:MAG: hypothetical protein P4M02_03760 [Clostridia bacterium]|nr:hypothetical protein [Clostridia bacterium]